MAFCSVGIAPLKLGEQDAVRGECAQGFLSTDFQRHKWGCSAAPVGNATFIFQKSSAEKTIRVSLIFSLTVSSNGTVK